MAVTHTIYSNANARSQSISIDFVNDVLSASFDTVANVGAVDWFFKVTTGAQTVNSLAIPTQVVVGLDDLTLNSNVQSQSNNSSDYSNVKSMVIDYVWDFVNGHATNRHNSGVGERREMKFT